MSSITYRQALGGFPISDDEAVLADLFTSPAKGLAGAICQRTYGGTINDEDEVKYEVKMQMRSLVRQRLLACLGWSSQWQVPNLPYSHRR
jgi:hypothetical protein